MEKENTESVFTTGRGTVIAVISAEARAKARTLSEIIDKEIKEDPLFQAAVKCDLEEVEAEQNEPLKVSEDTVGSSGVKRPREPLDNESPEDAVDLNAVRTPDVKKAKSRKFGGFKTPRPVPKVPSSVPVGTNTLADLSPLAQVNDLTYLSALKQELLGFVSYACCKRLALDPNVGDGMINFPSSHVP